MKRPKNGTADFCHQCAKLDFESRLKFFNLLQKKYKEDWESDKDLIYYPATLTPVYESMASAQKNTSDVSLVFGLFCVKYKYLLDVA